MEDQVSLEGSHTSSNLVCAANLKTKHMNDLIDKLYDEHFNLEDKIFKLDAFIISDEFLTVSEKQQELLEAQYDAMKVYADILLDRIMDLKTNSQD
jgi:predicted transcriptional regulator